VAQGEKKYGLRARKKMAEIVVVGSGAEEGEWKLDLWCVQGKNWL
jgi:hypothetical protein